MIILGIVLAIIGFVLLLAVILSTVRCRTETEAVIIRIIEKKRYFRGRTITDCIPEFSYTVDNKKYTAKADHSTTNTKKYSVGQKLTVFTDAKHPESVRYGSNAGFCIAGSIIALAGIAVIILAI